MHKKIRWVDVKKTHGCCSKNYALYNYGFSSDKTTCVSFTPIDSSHYCMYKNMRVQLSKK